MPLTYKKPTSQSIRLLEEIKATVEDGKIKETWVEHPKSDQFIHGLTFHNGDIVINPAPSLLNTLIHECLHRLYPDWSENYIRNRTSYIIRRMTNEECRKLYNLYRKKVEASQKMQKPL